MNKKLLHGLVTINLLVIAGVTLAQLMGEGPSLKPENRISQEQIESEQVSLDEIRHAGLQIFTTPFNKFDGYGDGPK